MTYIMSCVWLDYMVKYFQCKNCVGSSPKTKKCVASFLVPGDTKGASTSRRLVDVFFFGYDAGNRTGRRTAVRKKAAGGRFFSPRVDSRQRHHKGSSHQPQVGGCFLFGYDSWESNRAAPANFLSVCPAALDKSPPSAL